MQILNISETPHAEVVRRTCEVLSAGGLVIFPTETTYGAGVDATSQKAVDKLLAYKSRREGKPLSIAVVDQAMAEKYVEVNESARRLYARFLPGPVTVISKTLRRVADGVASEFGTLGIRIPAYPLVIEIVKEYGKPMTSTSANGSGEKRPYTIQEIFDGLSEKQKSLIDLVIDAGTLPPNPPSTVIDTTLDTPVVFRQGEVKLEKKEGAETWSSHSEEETQDIARRLLLKHWNDVKEHGLVIGLQGSLGVGKTIFVKGLAKFLSITEEVTSPTYTFLQQYEFDRHGFKGELFHYDLWRLEKPEMLEHIGIENALQPGHVIAIEWPSLAADELKALAKNAGVPFLDITFTEPDKTNWQARQLQIIEVE